METFAQKTARWKTQSRLEDKMHKVFTLKISPCCEAKLSEPLEGFVVCPSCKKVICHLSTRGHARKHFEP